MRRRFLLRGGVWVGGEGKVDTRMGKSSSFTCVIEILNECGEGVEFWGCSIPITVRQNVEGDTIQ